MPCRDCQRHNALALHRVKPIERERIGFVRAALNRPEEIESGCIGVAQIIEGEVRKLPVGLFPIVGSGFDVGNG